MPPEKKGRKRREGETRTIGGIYDHDIRSPIIEREEKNEEKKRGKGKKKEREKGRKIQITLLPLHTVSRKGREGMEKKEKKGKDSQPRLPPQKQPLNLILLLKGNP